MLLKKCTFFRGSSSGESFQTAFEMAARQREHIDTHISVCNGLICLKLQNWLKHQIGKYIAFSF